MGDGGGEGVMTLRSEVLHVYPYYTWYVYQFHLLRGAIVNRTKYC